MPRLVLVLPAVLLLTVPRLPGAQTLRAPLRGGDPVLGLGVFERSDEIAILDSGTWFALVETDLPGATPPPFDGGVVRDGFVAIREGALLAQPPGATVESVRAFDVDSQGNLALLLELVVGGVQGVEDGGLYWNATPLLLRGWPAPGYGPGVWIADIRAVHFESDLSLLALISVDDPTLAGDVNLSWIRLRLGPDHTVASIEAVVREGDQLQGVPRPVRSLAREAHTLATDGVGNLLFRIHQTGSQAGDGVVVFNELAIARESEPAPIPDRRYVDLGRSRLTLNSRHEFAFTAFLDTDTAGSTEDDEVIVRGRMLSESGFELEVFAQEGQVLPSLAPHALASVTGPPLLLSEAGDLFWYARTNHPDASRDEVYLRNGEILLQKGVTTVEGWLVTGLRTEPNAIALSPDGRFLLAEVVLAVAGESLVWVDLGGLVPLPDCAPRVSRMRRTGGAPLSGGTLELGFEGAPWSGSTPMLLVSASGFGGCGPDLGFGEVLVRPPLVHTVTGVSQQGSAGALAVDFPADPGLIDSDWVVQGLWLGPSGGLELTNGFALTVGAP